MKRSMLGMVVAFFLAVAGLVIMQNSSEFSSAMANDGEWGNTIYDINCPAIHMFSVPSQFNISLAFENASLSASVESIGGAINGDSPSYYFQGTDIKSEKSSANARIWHAGPILMDYAACLGGYNSMNSNLLIKAMGPPMFLVKFDNDSSVGSWSSLQGTLNSFFEQVLIPAPTIDSDMATFYFGRSKPNMYVLGYEFPAGIQAYGNIANVTITFKSSLDTSF